MSLFRTTGPAVLQRGDTNIHFFLYKYACYIWPHHDYVTRTRLHCVQYVKSACYALHVPPRMKISQFCYLGREWCSTWKDVWRRAYGKVHTDACVTYVISGVGWLGGSEACCEDMSQSGRLSSVASSTVQLTSCCLHKHKVPVFSTDPKQWSSSNWTEDVCNHRSVCI